MYNIILFTFYDDNTRHPTVLLPTINKKAPAKVSGSALSKNLISSTSRELIQKAQQIVENISRETVRLFQAKEIDGEDLHKILLANAELFRYLNSRYVKDEKLNEEVLSMAKTLYDPVVEARGKIKGKREIARKLLQKKMSIDEIKEITDLSDKEIEKIKRQMEN
ncbi:MAG: hypothetical protein PHP26_08800 [Syntrophomonas sp.]|uniref:hypothetical protein n=1 Tax=Syntrophomonas sp. TaxID=2053627 RepID=UPI002619E0EF|nr:hypothetical protein [Syntrophomonas sp.]MDD2511212.1 hypothetical protein [Syntrophomonas sp.]MDD3880072.1 hypothetical protein [Syntrophomonas sp.]MDD4627105.1 hypothetical protein [Syntrophomonas sp.]